MNTFNFQFYNYFLSLMFLFHNHIYLLFHQMRKEVKYIFLMDVIGRIIFYNTN